MPIHQPDASSLIISQIPVHPFVLLEDDGWHLHELATTEGILTCFAPQHCLLGFDSELWLLRYTTPMFTSRPQLFPSRLLTPPLVAREFEHLSISLSRKSSRVASLCRINWKASD
jgi:hypothetical protein